MTEPDISEVLAGALLENDQLRARVAELEGLLRRARSVIPNEYEDEIAVRTAINTYLNAHQGLGPGASHEPI